VRPTEASLCERRKENHLSQSGETRTSLFARGEEEKVKRGGIGKESNKKE